MTDPNGENVDVPDADENYKPPPEKTIEELLEADKEDESLRKYKETLLGEVAKEAVVVEPDNPRKVIVKKLALVVPGKDDLELDLSGDLSQLKKQVRLICYDLTNVVYFDKKLTYIFHTGQVFTIKEGIQYKIRIDFIVQREIVHGLKYVQKTYRLGVPGMNIKALNINIIAPLIDKDR